MIAAIKKPMVILAVALVLLLAALLLGLVPINASFMKEPLASAVRETTGLDLAIGDSLTLRLGANPSISTGDIAYGDLAGERLLEVETLYARVAPFALLAGRIHVRELRAQGIRVDYCRKLPQLGGDSDENEQRPQVAVDRLELRDTAISCGKPAQPDSIDIYFPEIAGAAPYNDELRLRADGKISDLPISLTATAGPLSDLISDAADYPVDIELDSEYASATVAARLENAAAIQADIRAEVTDLRSALGLFDVHAPDLGALRLDAKLRGDRIGAEFDVGAGELGNSRFALDATIDRTGDRPHVTLAAAFDVLDIAPFLAQAAAAAAPDDKASIPDSDLRPLVGALDALDAELELTASRITGLSTDLDAVELSAHLSKGNLEVRSVAADALGGRLSGSGRFDGGADCPALAISAQAADIDLATINSLVPAEAYIGGRAASAVLESTSCGITVHKHRDSLRAQLDLRDVSAAYNGRPIPVTTKRSRVLVVPGERIRADLTGELGGVPVQATLLAGTPENLRNQAAWPVELTVDGERGHLSLHGKAATASDKPFFDGSLELDAPRFGTMHQWIGSAPEADYPLHGSSQLRFDRSTFVADRIALSLGKSNLGGRFAWHYGEDPDLMDIVLRSTHLDLAELAAAFPPDGEPVKSSRTDATPVSGSPVSDFALPRAEIDISLDAVHAKRLDLQNIKISGRLRKGLIEDARMSLLVEDDLLLRGGLDMDLRRLPAKVSLHAMADNFDIGQILRRMGMETDLRMRADGMALDVRTQGHTPRELVMNSQVEAELNGFDWLIPKSFAGEDERYANALNFNLDELRVTMAPEEPATWSSVGHFDGVLMELWMQTPSLVDTFANEDELPLTLVLAAGDNVAMLDAQLGLTAENEFRGQLWVSGAVVDSEGRDLASVVTPLQDYELRSTLLIGEERLTMPDLHVRLGSSSASGSITVRGGDRYQADVIVNAPHLQTDDLLYWARDFRDAIVSSDEPDPGPVPEKAEQGPAGDAADDRSVLLMAGELIASFQENNDLTVAVTVDDLLAGPSPLGHAELHLYVDEHNFRLQPLEFVLPGGGVSAEYAASVIDDRVEANLTVGAEALSYGGLLRLLDHESEARGLLFLDTEIRANAAMVPGKAPLELLLENADGHIEFAAWPENIEAGVLDLWTANLVLALLPAPTGGEASRLNCLTTRFKIRDGLMTSKTSLLDTTDTIVRGRGTIDLGKERLDLLVWPQAKREKFLSASTPVAVTGSFDDFRIGVEPVGFIGTLIRWYTSLIYVPFKWLTGERFPADGTSTCFDAMDWELTPELQEYFLRRDFSAPPTAR